MKKLTRKRHAYMQQYQRLCLEEDIPTAVTINKVQIFNQVFPDN